MVLFIGDSITAWWDKECFSKYFGKYNPINYGIAGHTTKDTLNYIKLKEIQSDLIIIQIGTNNSHRGITTRETVEDIKEIVKYILEISPKSRILLVGPLPRGNTRFDKHRVFNNEVNKLLGMTEFDLRVIYVDIGYLILNSSEELSEDIAYDMLHLTKKGYELLSEHLSGFISIIFSVST